MRAYYLALATMVALVPVSAHARDWPETAGWSIFEGADHCGIAMEYEGKGATELLVGLNVEGKVFALLTNTGWSASKEETYEIQWVVNGMEYSGTSSGYGDTYESRKGFGGKFGADFFDDLAKGSNLRIYRGDTLIDQLSLSGSGAAVTVAKRCVQTVKARLAAEEEERQRFSHIPDDPFAGGPTRQESAKRAGDPPRPLNRNSWALMDDYPARALREAREGTTRYILTVRADGRVADCKISRSSGHADLDQATCLLVTRRARFEPGGADGTFEGETKWAIPR